MDLPKPFSATSRGRGVSCPHCPNSEGPTHVALFRRTAFQNMCVILT